jgi:hypothetical protein
MGQLYKTTVVIWSRDGIPDDVDLEYIGREATSGSFYCSNFDTVAVADPEEDEHWDGTEFFGDVPFLDDGVPRHSIVPESQSIDDVEELPAAAFCVCKTELSYCGRGCDCICGSCVTNPKDLHFIERNSVKTPEGEEVDITWVGGKDLP